MDVSDNASSEEDEVFYTPGTENLLLCRKAILSDSLRRARGRITAQKSATRDPIKLLRHRRNINRALGAYELLGSQTVSAVTRTLSSLRVSSSLGLFACGSWDGSLSVLSTNELQTKIRVQAHLEKVGGLDWNGSVVVSGGQDGTIHQWRLDVSDAVKMEASTIAQAHPERITSTTYHPTGDYVASTSFDQTWKLWDARTNQQLLAQEGHSKAVLGGCFQPDGSIYVSGGQDAMTRVWDLRSGRCLATLGGHAQAVHSVDFSPNGHHLATASADGLVKVWDLRTMGGISVSELATIPAHTKLVSCVRFYRGSAPRFSQPVADELDTNAECVDPSGTFLVTSSFDNTVSVWLADNWVKVCSLEGHTDKVTACDVDADGTILSCGWDRNVRVWGPAERST